MLKRLRVKNFKSINEEIELSFEPSKDIDSIYLTEDNNLKMAIIYGQNASGKTNIIKAIEFIRGLIFEPLDSRDKKIPIVPFKFKDNIDDISEFEIDFIEDGYEFKYFISLNKNSIKKETLLFKELYSRRFSKVFERYENSIKWGTKIKLSKVEKDFLKLNTLENNLLLSAYSKVKVDIEYLDIVKNFFRRILPPIYPKMDLLGFTLEKIYKNEVNRSDIVYILKNADFAIDDFFIEESEIDLAIDGAFIDFLKQIDKIDIDIKSSFKKIEVFFTHFNKYRLKLEEESSGTQRFYQLAVFLSILYKNSYILPIDELESSLHPDLLKFFISIFLANSKDSQILITTHNRELLLEDDLFVEDMVWFCEKRVDGSTDLFNILDFGDEIKDKSQIYNLYKYGKIGAIPNIKNYLGIFE